MAVLLVPGTSHARYLNTGTGRFQTMDTFAGNNEDPLTLHKYLYCHDNPVNMVDPSGHSGEYSAGGMSGIMNIGFALFATISPVSSRPVSVTEIKRGTIWLDFGFDESTSDNSVNDQRIKKEVATLDDIISKSCLRFHIMWLGDIKTSYDWTEKDVPIEHHYSISIMPEFNQINGHAGGVPIMFTELDILGAKGTDDAQTYRGQGIAVNISNTDPGWETTIAHELGHWVDWHNSTGDTHDYTDPTDIMFSALYGGDYSKAYYGDRQYCEKVTGLAK